MAKITVTSAGNKVNIATSPDMSMFYTERSREWATSDKIVNNEDYSSKYYANISKQQADITVEMTEEVVNNATEALNNIDTVKTGALTEIINQEAVSKNNILDKGNTQIELIKSEGNTQVTNVNNAGITQVNNVNIAGTTQVNLAKEQTTIATNQAIIATEQATIAKNKTSEVIESGNTALSSISSARTEALNEINTTSAGYVENAEQYAQKALTSANNAFASEANALSYKNSALESSQTAIEQAEIATTQAGISTSKAREAVTSATNAKISETNAKLSETRCEEILSRLGTAIKIKGRVNSFENLPLSDNLDGDAYLVGTEGLDSYPEYYWYQDHWEFLGTTGTSLTWGLISGDITAQSDLMNKLNTKQNVLTAGTGIDITNNIISNTQTSAEWGNIQGTLTNQTDLQTALNNKQDKGDYALKTELDAKQNVISDLATIRSGAALGATALQNTDDCIHKTGNETVAGVKTFSSTPILSSGIVNLKASTDGSVQYNGTNFLRRATSGAIVLSGTSTIYLRPKGDTNTTNQLQIATDGTVTGTKFVGPLTGNATTATKATQDSSGQQINTTYIKGVTASNATITVTKGNGTTSTATINNVANATSATKATQDASGNVITSTYATKTELADKVDTSNTMWATNACIPDYSSGIGLSVTSNSFTYTCPSNGMITVKLYCSAHTNAFVYVNGSPALMSNSGSGGVATKISGSFIVGKGDVVSISGAISFADNYHYMYFYPMKGVS